MKESDFIFVVFPQEDNVRKRGNGFKLEEGRFR